MVKNKRKIIIAVLFFIIIAACGALFYIQRKTENADGIWEAEFYNCAEFLKQRIEGMDEEMLSWSEYDRNVRERRINEYLGTYYEYMDFVEKWIEYEGDSPEQKDEILKKATVLMMLIDDNHDANYGWGDINREYYQPVYYSGSRKKLLCRGNKVLQSESPIDVSMAQFEEECKDTNAYNWETYLDILEEEAWEEEFYNCIEQLDNSLEFSDKFSDEILDKEKKIIVQWREFIEKWAEHNEKFAYIDSGSGLSSDIAVARRECYRTAALLTISYYEQHCEEYEFTYDEVMYRQKLVQNEYITY